MPRAAVMPTARTLVEPESPHDEPQEESERHATLSPCTPPLRSIGHENEKASGTLQSEQKDISNWSPQTPESLPVTSINDVPSEGAVASTSASHNAAEVTVDATVAAPVNEVSEPAARPPASTQVEAQRAPSRKSSVEALEEAAAGNPLPPAPPSSSPPTHVDPAGELDGLAATSSNAIATGPSPAVHGLDSSPRRAVFFSDETDPHVSDALFVIVASYCDLPTLVQLMRVSQAAHRQATSDDVWRTILCDMNLPPLLAAYERKDAFYTFFLRDVVTTRALHGHYTFQAANNTSGSHGSVSNTSGSRTAGGNHIRDDDSLQEDVFNIASLQLLISAASLGQSNHLIGRVQLLMTYKNDSMEVLQGSCRFSVFRRCFSLCCSAFGTVKRGPVFTVAVATVTKPWANEGFEHFSEHKNGIRLVMTPVLWEGQSPGSQITEKDILVVSRPRPENATPATNVSSSEPPIQSRG